MSSKPFPKQLFGCWAGRGEIYFNTSLDAADLLSDGNEVTVGIYKLVGRARVRRPRIEVEVLGHGRTSRS